MNTLNVKLLAEFLDHAANNLKGEWLLVGGTLLPAVGLNVRSTVDIDLVGLGPKESAQSLELMTLAEKLGLSVETINPAATFFVNKVGYKKSDLLLFKKGRAARIYRPSFLLYLKLKLPRLTESDAIDLQHYFNYCVGRGDSMNPSQIQGIFNDLRRSPMSPEKAERMRSLSQVINPR